MSLNSSGDGSTLHRMVTVIFAVMKTRGDWFSLGKLAKQLDIPGPSMYRYLSTLINLGLLERLDINSSYRMTTNFLEEISIQGRACIVALLRREKP